MEIPRPEFLSSAELLPRAAQKEKNLAVGARLDIYVSGTAYDPRREKQKDCRMAQSGNNYRRMDTLFSMGRICEFARHSD